MGKNSYTNEELLDYLKKFYEENGRIPKYIDMNKDNGYPSYMTYISRFGSLDSALKLIGFEINNIQYNKPYTIDELLNELLRFYDENGRSPTAKDLKAEYGYPSYSVYRKRFKSLSNAIQLVGLNVNRFMHCTKEFLIEKLQEFNNMYGRSPTIDDINKLSNCPGVHAFVNMFGSFNNALIAADLEINNPYCYTDEYLISELHRYVETYGVTPTRDNFDKTDGYPSASVYTRAFGSFNNGIRTAGLSINMNAKYDYTIQNICTSCGCTVTKNGNMDDQSNFICKQCWTNNWRKNNYDTYKLWIYKRKEYGFVPLNNKFTGSNAHHLWLSDNSDLIVHLPGFLHLLNWHDHNKPNTLITPNAIALDYWLNEEFYTNLYLTGEVDG